MFKKIRDPAIFNPTTGTAEGITEVRRQEALLKTGALQSAIFNSANFSSIATDAKGVIQIFNVGAERMLGFAAADVMNKITPADISDPQEVIARAKALSVELGTPITPGFEALVFKASRGIEDIYELTYIRKDGSRFPAVVSVTALRDAQNAIIGYLLIGTDNTARKQADEKVRSAAQYARSLIEASLDPLVTISAEGKITDVNEGSIKVTGVPREKLIGTDFSDYFTEPERAREGYREAFSKGSVTDYPLTIRHKDASLTEVLYNASVYKDIQGNVLGVFAAARDVTARKQAEAALLKAGALQSAIFNSANFSSIATDAKGVIQIFNVGAERMLGYAAADVMNKITPADISDPREVIARAKALSVELGTPITPGFEALVFKASRGIEDIYELTYIRKDGSRFPAVVSVTALRDAQNAIIGYLLIGTDNTARKQVEEEQKKLDQRLRDQQFYTRSLIESNIDALMTTDPSGIITDVNKQMEVLTGCTRDELIGAPFKNYFTDPERAEAAIKQALSEKKVTNYELTARARDGKETVVSYNATTFYDRDRRLQGVFAAARDVTERKRLDQVLQEKNVELESARSVAEKANLAKSYFLSTVSHELRTPLTSIRGALALIAGGVVGELPAAAIPLVDIAHKNSERLIMLVNDILDMEKIEAGKMEFKASPVKLMPLLKQALDGNRAYAEQYQVSYELENDLPDVMVSVDTNRLMQLFANLLSNAAKYSPAGGKVLVAVERIDRRIRVAVKDNGPGIPDEFKDRIFQKFAQADSSDTRKKGGTGLGLSIAKAIVEQMGGSIGFDSQPNVQTTFYVEFPEWVARKLPEIGRCINGATHRVLVCEDSRDTATVLRMMLEQAGYAVDIAYDANQAKQLLAQGGYAAMTLDLILPGQSGISLIRELREHEATANLPILVVSVKAAEGRQELNEGEFGVVEWIDKPANQDRLLSVLNRVAGKSRRARPKVLHVEDDTDIFHVVQGVAGEVADMVQATNLAEARQMLAQCRYDLVILDLALPDGSGKELLPLLKGASPPIPVLVFSVYEIGLEDAREVDVALVKSRTDNAQLLATIKRLIGVE